MEILEVRLALAFQCSQSKQLGVQRVGYFARSTPWIDCIRCAVQHGAKFQDEMVPCYFQSFGTRAREREVLEVKRRDVTLELTRAWWLADKDTSYTPLERVRERSER